MNFTITGIDYETSTGSTPSPGTGSITGSITGYLGDPLYLHLDSDGAGGARIAINQNGPSDSKLAAGAKNTVTKITLTYIQYPGSAPQVITWNTPGVSLQGNVLDGCLKLLGSTTGGLAEFVVVDKAPTALAAMTGGDGGTPKPGIFGLIVLSPAATGSGDTKAFFVNVPVEKPLLTGATATIVWPSLGSVGGPIGGITVP